MQKKKDKKKITAQKAALANKMVRVVNEAYVEWEAATAVVAAEWKLKFFTRGFEACQRGDDFDLAFAAAKRGEVP